MKIIKLDGIKGIIAAIVIGACMFAGFVLCPGIIAMYLWNKYLTVTSYGFPVINQLQGILLWAMVVIIFFIISKNKLTVDFREVPMLTEEELEKLTRRKQNLINTQKQFSHLRIDAEELEYKRREQEKAANAQNKKRTKSASKKSSTKSTSKSTKTIKAGKTSNTSKRASARTASKTTKAAAKTSKSRATAKKTTAKTTSKSTVSTKTAAKTRARKTQKVAE